MDAKCCVVILAVPCQPLCTGECAISVMIPPSALTCLTRLKHEWRVFLRPQGYRLLLTLAKIPPTVSGAHAALRCQGVKIRSSPISTRTVQVAQTRPLKSPQDRRPDLGEYCRESLDRSPQFVPF